MHQPFNEFVAVPRVLLLTPFTVMAVAPHPTRLGVSTLCWERSLLSLTHIATQASVTQVDPLLPSHAPPSSLLNRTQPLFSTAPPGADSDDDGRASDDEDGGAAAASASAASSQPQRRSWSSWLRGGNRPTRRASRAGPALRPRSGSNVALGVTLPSGEAQAVHQVGVGVLASFAPETEDTVAFLRVWRAGRRPVARQGVLLKRKKGGWRERAPLGPLAWKRRIFSLQVLASIDAELPFRCSLAAIIRCRHERFSTMHARLRMAPPSS